MSEKQKIPSERDPICPWYYTEYCQRPYKKEKSQSKKEKIELDSSKKFKLEIISKAFNMTPNSFIDFVLNKEIDYIECLLDSEHSKEELEEYYEQEINIDELKKLVLIEEVL